MIIRKEDGTTYYYYYVKKRGRHKKPGPKKQDVKTTYKYYVNLSKVYISKYDFEAHEPKAYKYCDKMGWVDKLYPYVCRYTKKECVELCKSYRNSDDLKERNAALYECLVLHNWLNDIFTWRVERFTKENCYNEASKYKTYREFREGSYPIYTHCLRSGYLREYEWLIDDRVNVYKDKVDCVYMYMFEDRCTVYIGRTLECRIEDRDREHLYSNDVVVKFSRENGLAVPKISILESGLTLTEGLEREDFYVRYYKEKGYNVLNKGKTGIGVGSIGGLSKCKWNKESCYQAAMKCKSRKEFDDRFPRALKLARNNGWIDDYTWFPPKRECIHWDYEKCKETAKKCFSRTDFGKKHSRAYTLSLKNNWIDEFFPKKEKKDKVMKRKIFYKIDPTTMLIVGRYNKVKEITDDIKIYRVLNGDVVLFDDGFIYRRSEDVLRNDETGTVTDLLHPLSKKEKKEEKYAFVIDLLKNSNLKIKDICRISNENGIKICEWTCRALQKEFCGS